MILDGIAMTTPFNLELWQQTADYLLPVLIGEPMIDSANDHYWQAVQLNITAQHFPPGRWRDTWQAVCNLIQDGKPIHITTLQDVVNGTVGQDHLAQWYAMYQQGSTLRGHVFAANAETLRRYGETAYLLDQLHDTADRLMQGRDDTDAVVSDAITNLSNVGSHTIVNETAAAMAGDFTQYLSEYPDQTLHTGVGLIDQWTGGFGRGDFLAIVASMKQRKTSLMLNILINMARAGKSVALMMLESNKRMVNAMIVSMLSIEYIMGQGWYFRVEEDGRTPINQVSADALVKAQARYREWGKYRIEAVDYGIAEFRKLERNLRVYDKTRTGGSLHNIASIQRVCLRDKALFDTDMIAIDHAQRINEPGKDYEKLIAIVPYLETLARRENIAICLLAQLKADAAEGTGDSHLSGVRGGSILDEAVDYMIITGYKQKMEEPQGGVSRYPNDALMIGLQHSRYGDGGSHKRAFVAIDPNSGWLAKGGNPLGGVNITGNNIMTASAVDLTDLD